MDSYHNKTKEMADFIYFLLAIGTAMVGYTIHKSLFWSIVDFFFAPFAWAKWLIMQQINLSIIKETFSFFFK